MMKKFLIFSLIAILFLFALTGCNRNLRRDQTPQEPVQPAVQATLVEPPTLVPTIEATATQVPAPTETLTAQPTDTVEPTQGISQSDTIANQLDSILNQFNTQLQGVDTIPETP
jgi:hypothetical protein